MRAQLLYENTIERVGHVSKINELGVHLERRGKLSSGGQFSSATPVRQSHRCGYENINAMVEVRFVLLSGMDHLKAAATGALPL